MAFGLRLHAPFEIPELRPSDEGQQLFVHLHPGTPTQGWYPRDGRMAYGNRDDVAIWGDAEQLHLQAPPATDPVLLRLLLLGCGLSMALVDRGLPLLHATTVRLDTDVAICGPSGVGKSSFTAALLARGGTLVADDLCALDEGQVRIGFGRIKLWADAARYFGHDSQGLERVHPGFDKVSVPVPLVECQRPLARVVILERGEAGIRRIRGNDAMTSLLANHRLPQVLDPLAQAGWLTACAALSRQVEVIRVGLPGPLEVLEAQADALANGP